MGAVGAVFAGAEMVGTVANFQRRRKKSEQRKKTKEDAINELKDSVGEIAA